MGRLDDIQTTRKPLKKRNKLKQIFMAILGLAESFKIQQLGPTRPNDNAL